MCVKAQLNSSHLSSQSPSELNQLNSLSIRLPPRVAIHSVQRGLSHWTSRQILATNPRRWLLLIQKTISVCDGVSEWQSDLWIITLKMWQKVLISALCLIALQSHLCQAKGLVGKDFANSFCCDKYSVFQLNGRLNHSSAHAFIHSFLAKSVVSQDQFWPFWEGQECRPSWVFFIGGRRGILKWHGNLNVAESGKESSCQLISLSISVMATFWGGLISN